MTIALHPTVPATHHSIPWRSVVAAVLVVALAVLLIWSAATTSSEGTRVEQIAPGPPASVEVLSAMNAGA